MDINAVKRIKTGRSGTCKDSAGPETQWRSCKQDLGEENLESTEKRIVNLKNTLRIFRNTAFLL